MPNKVRVDKWLWAIRIFKSRSLSTNMCKTGKVSIGDKNLKPSTLLYGNEVLSVRKNGFTLQILVKELIEKRVGAPIAITCYENQTSDEEMNKYKDWYIGKSRSEFREKGTGRPTKKERREIEEYKEDIFDFDDDF